MATKLDFRHAYGETVRQVVTDLRARRRDGVTRYRLGKGLDAINPSRMSEAQILRAAERQAERVVERAINIHNASVERPCRTG